MPVIYSELNRGRGWARFSFDRNFGMNIICTIFNQVSKTGKFVEL